jgi:hypothetical protein
MSDTDMAGSSNRWDELIDLQPQQMVQIALLGVGVGLIMWIVTLIVRQVILVPLFCGDPTNGLCVGATGFAGGIATIIAGFAGLLGLVRIGVFRPMLVVLAAAIVLWGLSDWIAYMPWFEAIAWSVLLYALCYVMLGWIVRLRAFVPAMIVVLVVVILARFIPGL